ncbi:carboxylesterase family protein [Actinomadura barringtoniae]|uniref:Carboxylic ester hydrolase n=1 Tax=Actinomadura barringtoniae TaxID=1427535 RepID=A0A939P8L9_9ACTN|nr:carboxylesterase/lipase family protein [Actinomadura barringtoniae]MBO2447926.1 carboxylesterase family protein [Actinomadura barringtoniae]
MLFGASACGGAADAVPASHAATSHDQSTVISTDGGAVRGTLTASARLFQGIPYAAPPTGRLRWASPRRAAPWSGIRNATKPGNRCAQAKGLIDKASKTEDCLYLNVTTPRHSSARKLPVMVWIHGNGFINGAGSLYDAQRLANTGNVIVVSPNYRLGIFGFLAHPALDRGAARQLSGNFGLEDQQAALRWVQRNASAFGGDRANVTIFGESAGGTSVCSHLAAPGSAGLFQKAILQSGECTGEKWSPGPPTWFPLPRAEREKHGLDVASKLGCPDIRTAAACLRGKRAKKLAKWSDNGLGSGPTTGGGVLPLSPQKAFATGHFNRVPVIEGTTRDEHHLFTAAIEAATGKQTTEAGYRAEIHTLFKPADAARILARYPSDHFHSAGEALSTVVTDWAWACPVLDRNRALAAHVPLYAYEFSDENAPWFTTLKKPNFPTGAFHGGELQYLFNDEQLPGPATAAQRRLSDQMMRYWSQFAHTGNPNGPRSPQWSPFQASEHVQSLAPNAIGSANLPQEHQCAFWASIGN